MAVNGGVTVGGEATRTIQDTLNVTATIPSGNKFTLDLPGKAADNVDFNPSASCAGQITGLRGSDTIDLTDLVWGGNATAPWIDTNAGRLKVSDGARSATLAFLGKFSLRALTASPRSTGRAMVVDPIIVTANAMSAASPYAKPHTGG